MPRPSLRVRVGSQLSLRVPSRYSASSVSTFNSIRTTYRFHARSKAEASNDDSDDLDDETPVYGSSVTGYSLARGQMIGEQEEMIEYCNKVLATVAG